jgi:3-dehydroquinate dehydratase/shikimate dehydrogenase
MPTLLCVPIMVDEVDEALHDAALARTHGADLVEFRVDRLFHGEQDEFGARAVSRLVDESPLPCIITCRSSAEGGDYDGDEAGRVALWEHLGTARGDGLSPRLPPRYLDVELSTYSRSANLRQKVNLAVHHGAQTRDLSSSMILSAHDFQGRPANLARLVAEMRHYSAASVLKIAWRARSLRDNLEVFEVLRERDRPTIALAMGEFGLMSRVLAPKFGGFLTFASLRENSTTAPGQPTIRELLDLYRFRSIGPATRVFGVMGWPVAHSLSPAVHNAGFEASGLDCVYVPMPVATEWEHFKATLLELLDCPWLGFGGASITLPHKEHLLRLASEDRSRRWEIEPLSRRIGAANTLAVDEDGTCRICNTDAAAVVSSLRAVMGPDLSGKRIAVIGAGGAARAAAVGLADAGATAVIYNRTRERAERLVAEVRTADAGRISVGPWEKLCASCCDAFVNCTPLGMTGGPDPQGSALDIAGLRGWTEDTVVMDTVYRPLETPLVKAARARGLRVIEGDRMFIEQARAQFEFWCGKAAPAGLYERVVREALTS